MMNEYIYHKPYFLLIHTKDFQVYKNLVFIFLFVVALPPAKRARRVHTPSSFIGIKEPKELHFFSLKYKYYFIINTYS